LKIFAFPHAGGDSYCYRDLQPHLSNHTLETQNLPGRGKLFGEPLLHRIHEMAENGLDIVKSDMVKPYAFYGHSMGAMIAYLTTLKIRDAGLRLPEMLFLSGRKAPSLNTGIGERHNLPTAEFRKELESLGGCPKEVLDNAELMELFEPILRADFESIETYTYEKVQPLNIKIVLFHGSGDHFSKDDAMGWQSETDLPMDFYEYNGSHFFIHQEWESIAKIIDSELA